MQSNTNTQPRGRVHFSHTFITPLLVCAVMLLILIINTVSFDGIEGGMTEAYLSLVAMQLFVFMLPSIFYIRYRALDARDSLRIRIPSPDKIMFILLCSALLVVLSVLMTAVGADGNVSIYANRYMEDARFDYDTAVYYAVCFALVPALCEELLFRGIVMCEYQRTSVFSAVIISSLYFALSHFDPSMLVFFFLSGLVLSMCAYATGSIIASFFVHLIYNLFAIFGGEIVDRVLGSLGQITLVIIVLGALLLLLLSLIFGECERIYRSYSKKNRECRYVHPHKKGTGGVRFALALLSPTSLILIVMYVIVVLLGGS
ncbi:MAG: CPBP family intramembrane metalloprotease [Clostridia bacterium]|nr:CPBP family intramembrane metalloprotease [Clostridia bacterium]